MLEFAQPKPHRDCAPEHPRNPRWSLAVAIAGSTMVFVDSSIVNVALPVIQRELDASVSTMQWIVESYALMLAALVLVGGALGDRFGRRRVFNIGVLLFTFASAACGLAPSPLILIFARGIQGIGGALLVPGSLALISAAYDEHTRGAAIGTWSSASSVTSAIGPLAGGYLVAHASWRWLFLLNVPLGILTVLFAQSRVEESRDDGIAGPLDWRGTAIVVVGLGLLVTGLLEHSSPTADHRFTLAAIGCGCLLLAGFVWVESRTQYPLVPLSLFSSRTFSGVNLLTLLLYAALGGTIFFLPFNLVQVQGYAPSAAGAALLPMIVAITFMGRWSGGLVSKFGPRLPLVVGPLISTLGFLALSLPGTGGSYVTTFLPGIVLLGLGMGTTVAPLTTTVMQAVPARHAGLASGINNAVARTASLLAIAVLGLILMLRFNATLDSQLDLLRVPASARSAIDAQRDKLLAIDLTLAPEAMRSSVRHAIESAFVSGFRLLMLANAALAALSSLAAWLWVEQ
jgi:EmrB/QacA subfamily drug resistance transporter